MKDGTVVTLRPIRPEDEPLIARFHENLSERSVYLRYFYPMKLSQRIEHERLSRICFIDYDREMALVAETHNEQGEPEIIAAGRLIKLGDTGDAEFAILVTDKQQGKGLGTEILRQLVEVGRQEGIARIVGSILSDNPDMLHVAERLGFKLQGMPKDGVMRVLREL
jgi:acetyltransferase